MTRASYVFHSSELMDHSRKIQADLQRAIASWDPDDLLSRPAAEIVEYLVEQHGLETLVLDSANAYILDEDRQAFHEVGHPYTFFGETARIAFKVITLAVPFMGNRELFNFKPSSYLSSGPPQGKVVGSEVHLFFETPENEKLSNDSLNQTLFQLREKLEYYAQRVVSQAEAHNQQIRIQAVSGVNERRAKLTENREQRASLAFPLKRRPDGGQHAVPLRRRKLATLATRPGTEPIPYLADTDYEEVLRVLMHQRNQFERSPSLLANMEEEAARDILLIGLNGQFEGRAVGEAFNRSGKTDILIREGDRNVFVGECKFWRGPATINKTLDQLFERYLTWRDTKAALLLFIRDVKSPTEVIDKALQELEGHARYVDRSAGDVPYERYNYLFRSPTDPQQHVRLAFLPFVFA